MSKLLAIVTSLMAILIAASVAFARGDMLPVILISVLFNLVQLGAKPGGHPSSVSVKPAPSSTNATVMEKQPA